ncbi:probable carotenoid cleavage dioxygenase 4, chloroplastic [Humulus lupulus]|uniref:probable carotenoid cleavage dioxygenase 4, chloroplastic n=1 Tax=Humulus lupulus TaxID=3486 RepID=UPI002B40B69A|nr:probable carotenoid cleavage dioxygenase 4, chloroplastic [Humulus lupulus]
MDAFSSSFVSSTTAFSNQNYIPSNLSTLSYSTKPNHVITSVRIEDKPPSSSTTTINKPTTSPQPPPTRPSSSSSSVAVRPPKQQQQPRSPPTLPGAIFNAFDDIINTFVDPPLRPSVDPKLVLSTNFAPVLDELPPTKCHIEYGTLPTCLDGAYIRNGPNPQFLPRGPYHLFDGDGMLHCLRISQSGQSATLSSRYVNTYKYDIERRAGHPLIPNVFSGFNGLTAAATRGALSAARIFTGQFNPANGIGLANTSLAFFADRLYALGESDLPYEVRVTTEGDIQTVGRRDFDGKLNMSMTAHPKIDPDTGETFAFRYGPIPPFLTYFRFDQRGEKQPDVPIFSMTSPSFLHDFAITKKYAIFTEIQLGMNPMDMIVGGGSPVGANPSKVSRVGVIPRYAKDESEMKWFEVPGFNLMHAVNAWDEEDAVVMVAPNILSIEHTLERLDLVHALVEKVRIDLKTGVVSRQPLSAMNLDFGVINPAFVAKKNKYVYAAVGDPMPKISGVVKLDVSRGEAEVGRRMYGPGCYGGEPFFVAKEDCSAEEDEGYLVTYLHDEKSGESRFVVMDAKSPELEIVASVKLPARVPYGFHGIFVKESDLRKHS